MASTATSASGYPPGVLEEIAQLFSWNPPKLKPGPKLSTVTRLPSFYDKHFAETFVLKKVERLPSLIQDLAKNVDQLLAASNTLPPLDDGFPTASQREVHSRYGDLTMNDERAVTSFYERTTGTYCSIVASTLLLHPTIPVWQSLLQWTQSGRRSAYAIMYGQLSFCEEGDGAVKTTRAQLVSTMDGSTRLAFEKLRGSQQPLATWVFKNITAGSVEIITAVPNLGKFSWTYCTARECEGVQSHDRASERVRNTTVGLDAQVTPWILPTALPILSGSESSLIPLSDEGTYSPTKRGEAEDMPLAKGMGRKRKRSEDQDEEENLPPTKGRGKRRQRREDEDEDDEDDAYKDAHDVTAQSLVQRMWAQAVLVDGSIIILHSGNHELVCIRHRASQTLYVSDLIEPPMCVDPGYGKLHVGVYVAATQDAIRRQQQLFQSTSSGEGAHSSGGNDNRGPGSDWKDNHGNDGHERQHRRGRSSGLQGSGGSRGSGLAGELEAIEKLMHGASNCDIFYLYLRYDMYDSQIHASFLRSSPPIMPHTSFPTSPLSPGTNRTHRPDECMTIVLTSEIGHGATGVVHRGTLEICGGGSMPLDVIVKLAFDTGQQDALKNEYEVYRQLWLRGVQRGITRTMGLFDDCEGAACALVMLYAGVALSTELQRNLSIPDCKSALSTLESIHHAGILHGDIRQENILIGDTGVTIIDFGHSRRCNNKKAKANELTRLRCVLGLEGGV